MEYSRDENIILLLDAGGTNFVFSAIMGGKEVVSPITKASNAHELNACIETLISGFEEVAKQLPEKPAAISFAFPGPADYPNGIIGNLPNLPAFRNGVALGPILQNHFNIPVFINNDGDLFAYGEALVGVLPEINKSLKEANNPKQYKNLIGITLGTGFGGGIVRNNQLFIGDNSTAAEIWLHSNRINTNVNAEEGVSTRAVQNYYKHIAGIDKFDLMPKDIYDIATGNREGNKEAALQSFEMMGRFLGDVIANLLTVIDGIAVIGGGMAAASTLYMPSLMKELRGSFPIPDADPLPRLVQSVFNYDIESERQEFLTNTSHKIPVYGTDKFVEYDSTPRLAITTSKLGASKSIAMGAYAFALQKLK